jgi:hypothetical protein
MVAKFGYSTIPIVFRVMLILGHRPTPHSMMEDIRNLLFNRQRLLQKDMGKASFHHERKA